MLSLDSGNLKIEGMRLACALLCGLALAGCGKKQEDSPAAKPSAPAPVEQLAPTATTVAAPTTTTRPSADDFDAVLREVLQLERDGMFPQALVLCRKSRSKFRSHPRVDELAEAQVRLQEAKREAVRLKSAIRNLGSSEALTVAAARQQLQRGGNTALILLRNAARAGGPAAVEAVKMLGAARDSESVPFFVDALRADSAPEVVSTATEAMSDMPDLLQPDQLAACYDVLMKDKDGSRVEVAGVLQAFFDEVCGGDVTNFNARVGHREAYRNVRGKIEQALVSDDASVLEWATRRGGSSVGTVNAIRGRYYYGRKFEDKNLVIDRFDREVYMESNRPQFPSNRQHNVSVRWTADLEVPEDGLYYFYLGADDRASLWINGKTVLQSTTTSDRTVSNQLARGKHPIRVDFENNASSARVWLSWSGPGIGKRRLMPVHAMPRPEFVSELNEAIPKLSTNDYKLARQVKSRLALGGSTASILLRDAFMNGDASVSAEALEQLVLRNDGRTTELLLEKLAVKPDRGTTFTYLRALRDLSPQIAPADYAALLDDVLADDRAAVVPGAVALCGVLEQAFRGDKEAFNAHFAKTDAYDALGAYINSALNSEDLDSVIRALVFGTPFVPYLNTLEAQGYLGEDFEDHAFDMRWATTHAANYRLGFSGNRYNDVSLRWTGGLIVPKAGTYTFVNHSDGKSKLWISGNLIVEGRGHQKREKAVELEAGFHPFKYELRQGGGNSRIDLYWSAEGLKQQYMGTNVLRSPLWHAEADRLVSMLADLGTTNTIASEKCWARFKLFEPASSTLMVHALKTSKDNAFAEAARYLADGGDARAVPVLLERLRGRPSDIEREAQGRALIELVDSIDASEFPKLYAAFTKGPAMSAEAAILCAALVQVCGGKGADFNKLTGDSGAYAKLKAHVSEVLNDKDLGIIARACVYGYPFAPLANGFHGRYYHGRQRGRLVSENRRTVLSIVADNLPGLKRQDDVAAEWYGFLKIDKAGKYTMDLQTDMPADLVVDNKVVLRGGKYQVRKVDLDLSVGLHPISLGVEHGTGNNRVIFHWSGPDLPRTHPQGKYLRTRAWFKDMGYLTNYVVDLASTDKSTRQKAEKAIKTYGEVAQPFLVQAVRYQGDSNAVAAARFLLQTANPSFGPSVAERIASSPSAKSSPAFAKYLVSNTNAVDGGVLGSLHASLKKDSGFELRWLLPYFEKVFVTESKSDAAAYGKRVGSAGAFKDLQDYITRGVKSADTNHIAWMLSNVGVAYPQQGLRGQYFADEEKEKPYLERFEPRISFTPATYPFPSSGNASNFWARWSGYVKPPKAGQYVFRYNGDGKTVNLTVNEKAVPYSTQGTVQLKQGANAFNIEVSGLLTNSAPVISWSGPGIPNQVVSNSVFRVVPWK